MYRADYHTHSRYSYDGREELRAMCERAVAAELDELAVTDHIDIYSGLPYGELKDFDIPQDEDGYEFGTQDDPAMKGCCAAGDGKHFLVKVPGGEMVMPFGRKVLMDLDGLAGELADLKQEYAGRLKLRAGAELGQPFMNPEEAAAYLRDTRLDFVIGSIHNMDYDLDVYYYDFGKIDAGKMYRRYLELLIQMARDYDFDVLGHLSYPLRYLREREGRGLDLRPYYDGFRELFRLLSERGRGIELNISGWGRAMGDTMPPFEILRLYRECGGEIITIGSDAHILAHIGENQKRAQRLLADAGFRYLTVYEERRPSFVPLG